MIYTVTLNPALDRELTVPEIIPTEVLRATRVQLDVGGKGFNVARMLTTLGTPCTALGFAGGHTGAALRDGLTALGIPHDLVPINGETRSNLSIVSASGGHPLKVNEPGPTVTPAELTALRARVTALARPDEWWVLAGSLPPGAPADFYATLIAELRAAGALTALDTSGAALHHGCAAGPTLIKPNAQELAELTGLLVTSPTEALAAVATLSDIRYNVVSLGAAGALLLHNGRALHAVPPPITERNPVGAGDAFLAGVIWGLANAAPATALRWGVACGAAAAASPGTAQGSQAEVARLAALVRVQNYP